MHSPWQLSPARVAFTCWAGDTRNDSNHSWCRFMFWQIFECVQFDCLVYWQTSNEIRISFSKQMIRSLNRWTKQKNVPSPWSILVISISDDSNIQQVHITPAHERHTYEYWHHTFAYTQVWAGMTLIPPPPHNSKNERKEWSRDRKRARTNCTVATPTKCSRIADILPFSVCSVIGETFLCSHAHRSASDQRPNCRYLDDRQCRNSRTLALSRCVFLSFAL